ncbi:MAG: cupin domain-containing protein [Chloroflexota bacterium]|nr:cupin domain-containing protein [Chloroflexota bacterium]
MTHFVARIDWEFSETPADYAGRSSGLAWRSLVGRESGAVHTELTNSKLAPGGRINSHVHAYEEAVYVLAGRPVLAFQGRRFRLRAGDFALVPLGMAHAWSNAEDSAEARWLTVHTPQRIPAEEGRHDTFFLPGADLDGAVEEPELGPLLRYIGHYEGTPPQAEVLRLDEPARGRRPAGMDTALLAYSGISVKMLVDRVFGAELLTMFTVDYEPGGAAQVHDHPFEEAYFFLDGEIEAELGGERHIVRAGDIVFAGVGATHGFFNTGGGRVRWIETQAPQPPGRHSYRWVDTWKRLEARERSS